MKDRSNGYFFIIKKMNAHDYFNTRYLIFNQA